MIAQYHLNLETGEVRTFATFREVLAFVDARADDEEWEDVE